MKSKILLLISQLRGRILKKILYLSGFKIIREHWLYTKELKSDSVIIDLGANTGTFSQVITTNYNSKCFAIEPNIKLFNSINDSRLTKLNYAVTKNDGLIDFYISENHEASSLQNNFQDLWKVTGKHTVEGISLISLLQKLGLDKFKVDVLKMDVEGAELDIIDSFDEQNSKNIKQVTIEFHHKLNPNLHERTKQAIKKLLSLGFVGISNTISPTEILFLRDEDFDFNSYQHLLLKIYKKLSFSAY